MIVVTCHASIYTLIMMSLDRYLGEFAFLNVKAFVTTIATRFFSCCSSYHEYVNTHRTKCLAVSFVLKLIYDVCLNELLLFFLLISQLDKNSVDSHHSDCISVVFGSRWSYHQMGWWFSWWSLEMCVPWRRWIQ